MSNQEESDSSSGSSPVERNMDMDMDDFCVCSESSDESNTLSGYPGLDLEKLRRLLCEFVVAGGHPFSIIETSLLKNLMSVACPASNVITKQALWKDAFVYYKEERIVVESELLNVPGRICFALDYWNNIQTEEEYVQITTCWHDHNWILQKRVIRLSGLTCSSDGDSLAKEILSSLSQWKVADKVFSFVIDDASYSDALVASLCSNPQMKQVLNGEFLHMRSYSHIINLLGESSLKLMDDVLPKIRNIVMHIKNSTTNQEKFYEVAQMRFSLDTTERLCLDTFTGWDTTLLMLDRFVYYRDVIVNLVSNDANLQVFCLTQEEWAKVDEVREFLKVVYKLTSTVSNSHIPIANIYLHMAGTMHEKLLDICNGPPSIISSMVKAVQPEFEKYWSDFRLFISCAAVLDPRFKLTNVECWYESLYGEDRAKELIVTLKETLFHLCEEYKKTTTATSPVVGISKGSKRRRPEDDAWITRYTNPHAAEKIEAERQRMERSEMESYLHWSPYSIQQNIDPLEFWKKQSSCPVLSAMARDIFTAILCVGPLESGFTKKEKLIAPCRCSLLPENIEALTCYRDWLCAKGLASGVGDVNALFEGEEDGDVLM